MAVLITFETFKNIRTLCENFNISTQTIRKKLTNPERIPDFKKKTTNSAKPVGNEKIKLWFCSLQPLQSQKILQITNSFVSNMIVFMYLHKYQNGNAEFSFIEPIESKNHEFGIQNFIKIKKLPKTSSKTPTADEEFEKKLLFFDFEEYCDSFIIRE